MNRYSKMRIRGYSTVAAVGLLIFSSFAYAGECEPLEIVESVDTLLFFELDKPNEQKPISKALFPRKICGLDEASKGRYLVCLNKRQVLVLHAQFKLRNLPFVPPAGPENPSNRGHAGTFATLNQSEELASAPRGPYMASARRARVASRETSSVADACNCKNALPKDCE